MLFSNATGYYPEPYSLNSLPTSVKHGLLVISCLAALSLILSFSAICLIIVRIASWGKRREKFDEGQQCILLILNLLTADFLQALAFVIGFHWIQLNGIFAPSAACWVQAGILNTGDVASGFFVFSIALHTLYTLWAKNRFYRGNRLPTSVILVAIAGIWLSSVLLTLVGPLYFGKGFFVRAGNWCWISHDYENERLFLHYFWIIIDGVLTALIYLGLFISTRLHIHRTQEAAIRDNARTNKASWVMFIYALMYCALTLPVAICRMISMSGHNVSNTALLVAGGFITSCGWVDALVYTFTRKLFVRAEVNSPVANSDEGSRRGSQRDSIHPPRPAIELRDLSFRQYGYQSDSSRASEDATNTANTGEGHQHSQSQVLSPISEAGTHFAGRASRGTIRKETTIEMYRSSGNSEPDVSLWQAALEHTNTCPWEQHEPKEKGT